MSTNEELTNETTYLYSRKVGSIFLPVGATKHRVSGSFVSEGHGWKVGTRVWYAMAFADCTGTPEEIVERLFPGCEAHVCSDYAGLHIDALTPLAPGVKEV